MRLSSPYPFGMGRGSWHCILACEEPRWHRPSSREEAHSRYLGDVGGLEGEGEGESGGGEVVVDKEKEQRSTMMWLICISNSACHHR